ncbi:MAG: oligosaccharide flippase family protein [Solirubrobacterales bacterium]
MRFDVLVTVGGKALFVALGGLTTVLIARHLGPTGQGVFAVSFNLTLILVQLGSSGLSVAAPTLVARDSRLTGAIITNSLLLALGGGLLLIAGSLLVKAIAPGALPGLTWTELGITLAALPAALATMFMQAVLQGQGRMVAFGAIDVAQATITLAGLLVAILAFDVGLVGVLLVIAVTRYLLLLIALTMLRREAFPPAPPERVLLRRMLAFGARIYAVGLVTFLLIRLDLLLVNSILGQRSAGLYSLAGYISEALSVVPSIVAVNMVARLARDHEADTSARVFRATFLLYGGLCLLSLPAVAIGLPLLYGSAYQGSVELYFWLAPGIFFLGLLSVIGIHFSVRGYPPMLVVAWIAGLVLDIALNVMLLGPLGLFIAPLSSTVAYGFVLAAHLGRFAREMGGWHELMPRTADIRALLNQRTAVRETDSTRGIRDVIDTSA